MAQPRWHRWGRPAVGGALGAVVIWYAFVRSDPVPILDWFDLGIHEAGHFVAAALPEIAMFIAGSLAQVAVPLGFAVYFGWRRRDLTGGGFCLVWAGASAWDVSVYAGDAVRQSLPLIGGGQHDWAFILRHFDALHLTDQIAQGIETGGLLLAIAGMGLILADAISPAEQPAGPAIAPASETPAATSVPATAADIPGGSDPWATAAQLPFRYEGDRESA
jgi:hypothetical protein